MAAKRENRHRTREEEMDALQGEGATRGFVSDFLFWSGVAWAVAVPSLFFGAFMAANLAEGFAAMATGIFLFALLYALASRHRAFRRLWRSSLVTYTITFVATLRVGQATMFCVLYQPDYACGVLSLQVVSAIFGLPSLAAGRILWPSPDFTFFPVLAATIVQGVQFSAMLVGLVVVVCGPLFLLLPKRPEDDPTRFCAACGYDLRASSGRCPECGAAVPGRQESGILVED